MSILETIYASAPASEVLIPTLDLAHPAFSGGAIRFCWGFDDVTATLETGVTVTFEASGMDVSLPKRNASGQQNLQFALENVTGRAQRAIDAALEAGGEIIVRYREYRAADLSAPAGPVLKMVLVKPTFEGATLQVTASYMDLINQACWRARYNTTQHPGLKYT